MRFAIPAIAFDAALLGGISALTLNTQLQQKAERSRITRVESLLELHRQNYLQNLALERERDETQCDKLVSARDETKDRLWQLYDRNDNASQELQEYLVARGPNTEKNF